MGIEGSPVSKRPWDSEEPHCPSLICLDSFWTPPGKQQLAGKGGEVGLLQLPSRRVPVCFNGNVQVLQQLSQAQP